LRNLVIEAVSVLNLNENIGVVHGHAEFFGEKGIWYIKSFDLESKWSIIILMLVLYFEKRVGLMRV
jgi:hypothetical protein